MRPMTKAKMYQLLDLLPAVLGRYWTFALVEKKDDENVFDPPCRYVEARLLTMAIRICADGEYSITVDHDILVVGQFEADPPNIMINAYMVQLCRVLAEHTPGRAINADPPGLQ